MLNPSPNAFRFAAGNNAYAVDIQNNFVILLIERLGGWVAAPEFTPMLATDDAIAAAGGPVKFVDRILAAANKALRAIFGKPATAPGVETPTPQLLVLANLAATVKAHTLMDGSVELQRK